MKLPVYITTPFFISIIFILIGSILYIISYLINHHEINDNIRVIGTFICYITFLLILKYTYKWFIPSLINIDRIKRKKQIEQLKNELIMHNLLNENQSKNIGILLADPNFDIKKYRENVNDFIGLIEDANEADFRMKARAIEATTTMIVSGGGYNDPKNRRL